MAVKSAIFLSSTEKIFNVYVTAQILSVSRRVKRLVIMTVKEGDTVRAQMQAMVNDLSKARSMVLATKGFEFRSSTEPKCYNKSQTWPISYNSACETLAFKFLIVFDPGRTV